MDLQSKNLLEIVETVQQRVKDLQEYLAKHLDLDEKERKLIEDVITDYKQQLSGFEQLKLFMNAKMKG